MSSLLEFLQAGRCIVERRSLGFFLRLAFLDHSLELGNDKITHLQRGKAERTKENALRRRAFSNNWGNEPFGA